MFFDSVNCLFARDFKKSGVSLSLRRATAPERAIMPPKINMALQLAPHLNIRLAAKSATKLPSVHNSDTQDTTLYDAGGSKISER